MDVETNPAIVGERSGECRDERPGEHGRSTPWWELVRFVLDARVRADPYAQYRRLREAGPIQHTTLGVTLVSGYDEALAVLRGPCVSSVETHMDHSLLGGRTGRGVLAELPARLAFRLALRVQAASTDRAFVEMSKRFLILMDPPDHTRIRRSRPGRSRRRVADEARPMIEDVTARVFDDWNRAGPST